MNKRIKNSKRNFIYGLILKILFLVLPFFIRTIIIKELGELFAGISGLYSSILETLSVAELGFNSAITFSLYKPLANDDTTTVNQILNFYRKVYRIIGCVILVTGLSIIPFLGKLINGEVPNGINIVILYLIYLFNSSIDYFSNHYLKTIIFASQREDLTSKASSLVYILQCIMQIVVLVVFKNYYLYTLVLTLMKVADYFTTKYIVNKYFNKYKCEGIINNEVKSEISKNVKGLVISKVCGVSRNALDNLFISAFFGLAEIAVYGNYYYISNAVTGFMVLGVSAITASIGDSIATNSKEENYETMIKLLTIYMWIAGWFTSCLFCLYQPFMELWLGKEFCYPLETVGLFCLYFYVLKIGDIQSIYYTSAGLYYEARICAILEAIVNVSLNYILGKKFGINGIISSTIISIFFINFLYGNRIVFKYYFKNSKIKSYYLLHFFLITICVISVSICYIICKNMGFITRIVICATVPNFIYFICLYKTKYFKQSFQLFKEIIKTK